jgi:hypothetical protein
MAVETKIPWHPEYKTRAYFSVIKTANNLNTFKIFQLTLHFYVNYILLAWALCSSDRLLKSCRQDTSGDEATASQWTSVLGHSMFLHFVFVCRTILFS